MANDRSRGEPVGIEPESRTCVTSRVVQSMGAHFGCPQTEVSGTKMRLSLRIEYPIVAIPDVHGQKDELARLLGRLSERAEWRECAVVFLGDFVDRGPDVRGAIGYVLSLIDRHPVVTGVMGNHDLALVRAARLDGGPHSGYWAESYRERYDHDETFRSYLKRPPRAESWDAELDALREGMPEAHRHFLASLPWLVEASGHLFLHNGLSPELEQSAEEQLEALRARRWDDSLSARPGTMTAALWQTDYPVWLGADKRLSAHPLAVDGKVQVTGHVRVKGPEADGVRIRLDTSGGMGGPLTACLLATAEAAPEFLTARD